MFVPIKHVIILPPTEGEGRIKGATADPEFPTTSRLGHMSPHARAAGAALEVRCVVERAGDAPSSPPAESTARSSALHVPRARGGGLSSGHRDSPCPHHLLLQGLTVRPPKSLLFLVQGGSPRGSSQPRARSPGPVWRGPHPCAAVTGGKGRQGGRPGPREGTRPSAPPP